MVYASSGRAITQPVCSRFWGEGRQSGALFAARPSRSAETRWSRDGYRSPDPQGVCQSEASIQRYRTCVYPTICRADRIRPCFGGFSQCLASRLTPSQRTRSSPFPNVDSFSREQTGTVAARAQWTDRLQGDPEARNELGSSAHGQAQGGECWIPSSSFSASVQVPAVTGDAG